MSSGWSLSSRLIMALVLSLAGVTMSACAANQAVEDEAAKVRAEHEAAAQEVRKSAEGGDLSAQNELGRLYYEGKGVPQDYRQAKIFVERGLRKAPRWRCSGLARRQSKKMRWHLENSGCYTSRVEECFRTLSRPTSGTTSRQHAERSGQAWLVRHLPSR